MALNKNFTEAEKKTHGEVWLAALKENGREPTPKTMEKVLGDDYNWYAQDAAYWEMLEQGVIKIVTELSPKGRKMKKVRPA